MLSSIPTRILIIVFLWIAEAARPAVDSDGTTAQSRHRPAGHGGSHGSHHSRLTRQNHDKADLEDEAEEGAPDGDAQDPADSDAASASKNDSSTNTGFFQDLIQGHEQIKSAMEGYQDVVAKGEQRALDAYDKLGEFQSTIKNLTEPLRSLPIQVHELRQKMVNNFEAQTKELEAELRGATAELTEDSSVENPEKGDGNGNDGDETTTPQNDDSSEADSETTTPQNDDSSEADSESTTPQDDAGNNDGSETTADEKPARKKDEDEEATETTTPQNDDSNVADPGAGITAS